VPAAVTGEEQRRSEARNPAGRRELEPGVGEVDTLAALGVAILPTLTLIGAAASVVARPIAGQSLSRFVYSCRLGTSRVPTAIAELEKCLDHAVAAVVLQSAEWS
jgi:hypothetical protein